MSTKQKALTYDATTQELSLHELDDISLEFMQKTVGGYIELVPMDSFMKRGIDIFCNDEGKFNGSLPSIYTLYEDKVYDVLHGNLVFCSHDEEGDSIGLTDEQVVYIEDIINNHKMLNNFGFLPYITQEGVY